MRVVIAGRGLPEQGGVPTFMQVHLRALQSTDGVEAVLCNLAATAERGAAGRLTTGNLARVRRDAARVGAAARDADVVHYHYASSAVGAHGGGDRRAHGATTALLATLRGVAISAAARWRGARVVWHVHSNDDLAWGRRAWGRALLWSAGRFVDAFLTVSTTMRDVLAEAVPDRRVRYVANAVVVAEYPKPRPPGDDRLRLSYVGVVAVRKGLDVLRRALDTPGLDGRLRLRVAGGAPSEGAAERDRVVAAYADTAPTVEFLGDLDAAQVAELLADTDVLVLPSFAEGLPMTILEAMASGCAVVATDVGQVTEAVVDATTGVVVPAGDVDALRAALMRCADDRASVERWGAAGRRRAADRFDVARLADDLVDEYRTLSAARVGRPRRRGASTPDAAGSAAPS